MFIGTNYPKLDEKFRLILPAKYRDRLAGGVYLSKGQENCIVLMPKDAYLERAEAILGTATLGTAQYRNLTRHLFNEADDQTPDGQGRILITQGLRNWAGLGRELVVAGVGRHIEIWNPEKYAALMAAGAEDFANYSEGEVTQI
jgi:MraZ protein